MVLAQGRILPPKNIPMCLFAVLGSQGIAVKCTAAFS